MSTTALRYSASSWYSRPWAKKSYNLALRLELTRLLSTLLRHGRDFLDVNRFLRGIEFARHQYVDGREVPYGFRIFDNPDSLIIVGHKDSALRFPFRVSHRSASTPTFLHTIRAAGLSVLGSATFIADPTRC